MGLRADRGGGLLTLRCPIEKCSGRLTIETVLPVGPNGKRQAVAYCPGGHGEIAHGPFLGDADGSGWQNWRPYDPADCQCGRKGRETCARRSVSG